MSERTLPVYLSLEQAAEMMSLSVKTIRRRVADGTIPAYSAADARSASASTTSSPRYDGFPPPDGERGRTRGTP